MVVPVPVISAAVCKSSAPLPPKSTLSLTLILQMRGPDVLRVLRGLLLNY